MAIVLQSDFCAPKPFWLNKIPNDCINRNQRKIEKGFSIRMTSWIFIGFWLAYANDRLIWNLKDVFAVFVYTTTKGWILNYKKHVIAVHVSVISHFASSVFILFIRDSSTRCRIRAINSREKFKPDQNQHHLRLSFALYIVYSN